jgi:hypothetical protein
MNFYNWGNLLIECVREINDIEFCTVYEDADI